MDRYQRRGRPPGQRTHQAEGRQFGPAQHPFPLRPVLTDEVPEAPLLACVTAVAGIRQMLAFSLLTSLRCMREGRHVPLSLTPPLSTPQCLLYSAEGSMPSGWAPFGIRSRCVLGLFVGACRVCVCVWEQTVYDLPRFNCCWDTHECLRNAMGFSTYYAPIWTVLVVVYYAVQ